MPAVVSTLMKRETAVCQKGGVYIAMRKTIRMGAKKEMSESVTAVADLGSRMTAG